MADRLMFFLSGLTARERYLLFVLCVVVLPAALYIGWVQPLMTARNDARAAVAETMDLRAWVDERITENRRLKLANQGISTAPIGIGGIEQSLIKAQLRGNVSELTRRGGDQIDLRFDAVPFVQLGDWVNSVSLDWGYEITAFSIERLETPGLVAVSFNLSPRS